MDSSTAKFNNVTIKSVLLIGQSNMAGRGDFGEVPEIDHPRCLMMRNGRWIPMACILAPPHSASSAAATSRHTRLSLASKPLGA